MRWRCALLTWIPLSIGLAGTLTLRQGDRNSAVRVTIYEDLQCPDCAAFQRMLDEKLLPRYGAKVVFEHRDFPLPRHTWARKAAIAARFFQGVNPELAVTYRRYALANRRQINAANFEERLAAFAKDHGVDPQKAVAALQDAGLAAAVEKDFQEGVARGVSKTPTVFVNGAPYIETFTFEEISKGIDAALAEAK